LREYTQGYPFYYGYKGDEVFLRILGLLFDAGIHSIELDNLYQGDFTDDYIPIKTRHAKLAAERYGNQIMIHLRLGPRIPDVEYYLKHMEHLEQKTAVGLFTSIEFEKIGFKSREEQLYAAKIAIQKLKDAGVETVRFSIENGTPYFQNEQRQRIEELVETAIDSGTNTIGLPKTCGNNQQVDMYRFGLEVSGIIPNDVNIRLHVHGKSPQNYKQIIGGLCGLLTAGHDNVIVETTLGRSNHEDSVEIPDIIHMNTLLTTMDAITDIDPNILEKAVNDSGEIIDRPSYLPPYEMAIGTHAAKIGNGSEDYEGQADYRQLERVFSHTTGKNALKQTISEIYGVDLEKTICSYLAREVRRVMSGDYFPEINPENFLDNGIPRVDDLLETILMFGAYPMDIILRNVK